LSRADTGSNLWDVEPTSPASQVRPLRPVDGWSLRAGDPQLHAVLVATGLVAAGFGIAFLTTLDGTLGSTIGPSSMGAGLIPLAATLWWLGLVAGGALLVAGTDRLAVVASSVRIAAVGRGPLARSLATLPAGCDVVLGVVPHDGRAVGPVVVGSFGVAVLMELPRSDRLRRLSDGSWEERTPEGWTPSEHPVDRAARDAERVRHWLTHGELDFVVRVHGALVTTDGTIPRSPVCAVIDPDQVGPWLAGLPPQRSLTEARRHRLVARIRETPGAQRRDW
jgi:hypothetical protein